MRRPRTTAGDNRGAGRDAWRDAGHGAGRDAGHGAGRGAGHGAGRDAGTATAELAVSLPALVLLLVVGLGALAVVRDQIEVVALAREVALAQARGEASPGAPGFVVAVSRDGETVRVVVTRHRRPLGGLLPGVDVSATAVAAVEPGE